MRFRFSSGGRTFHSTSFAEERRVLFTIWTLRIVILSEREGSRDDGLVLVRSLAVARDDEQINPGFPSASACWSEISSRT